MTSRPLNTDLAKETYREAATSLAILNAFAQTLEMPNDSEISFFHDSIIFSNITIFSISIRRLCEFIGDRSILRGHSVHLLGLDSENHSQFPKFNKRMNIERLINYVIHSVEYLIFDDELRVAMLRGDGVAAVAKYPDGGKRFPPVILIRTADTKLCIFRLREFVESADKVFSKIVNAYGDLNIHISKLMEI